MGFSLIIIGIIIGGILTILTVVMAIIALSGGKSKNALAWAGGFVVSLAIVIFSVVQLVQKLSHKIKSGVEWLEEHGNNNYSSATTYSNDDYLKNERQYFLDTLQKYTNEIHDGKVPADFYINKEAVADANGIITVPFLYPYFIRYNNATYTGDIITETSDSTFVQNVTALAFDQNFAIVKVDNSQSPELLKANHSETEYLLYDLRTRNFEPAVNKEKLMDLAKRIGYTGPTEMLYLSEYYKGWIKYEEYD